MKMNKRGFTLVELLVVIAIIGILAIVAVPALFENINKAKVADTESDYSAIKSATTSFYTDYNISPLSWVYYEKDTDGNIIKDSNGLPKRTDKQDDTGGLVASLESYMDSVPLESAIGGKYKLIGDRIGGLNDYTTNIYLQIDNVNITKRQFKTLYNDLKGKIYLHDAKRDVPNQTPLDSEPTTGYIGKINLLLFTSESL